MLLVFLRHTALDGRIKIMPRWFASLPDVARFFAADAQLRWDSAEIIESVPDGCRLLISARELWTIAADLRERYPIKRRAE